MRPSFLGALSSTAAMLCVLAVLPARARADFAPGPIAQAQPGQPDSSAQPHPAEPDSVAPQSAPTDSATAATADDTEPRGSEPGGEFAPTSEVPWNPDKKVPRAEQWESVMRTPGRILSLPFVALGAATQPILLMAQETYLFPRVAAVLHYRDKGLILTPASLGDRTGWGATVGFALPMPNPIVHAGISGSTRKYSGFGPGVTGGPFSLDYGYTWRPDELFYGFGLDAELDDRSAFASQSEIVQLKAVYPQPRRTRQPSRARLSA